MVMVLDSSVIVRKFQWRCCPVAVEVVEAPNDEQGDAGAWKLRWARAPRLMNY
jgi:hypothetical protein